MNIEKFWLIQLYFIASAILINITDYSSQQSAQVNPPPPIFSLSDVNSHMGSCQNLLSHFFPFSFLLFCWRLASG